MTTPNIEELIAKLRTSMGDLDCPNTYEFAMHQAADALQSQAERIKELEQALQTGPEIIAGLFARAVNMEKERDELREKYTDTYWALDDAARENTSLRAQLTAIAAAEPVAYRWVWKSKPWDIEGWCYTNTPPTLPELQEIEPLFTRPMPAQDVTLPLTDEQRTAIYESVKYEDNEGYWAVNCSDVIDATLAALSKYKGAK